MASETSASETGTSETGTSETGEDACYDIVEALLPQPGFECDLPQPCATVEFEVQEFDELCMSGVIYDVDAGQCILDALAAGEAAEFRLIECPGGFDTRYWSLELLGDDTLVWTRVSSSDGGPAGARTTWRALPESDYFASCSAETADELVACIEGLTEQACQLGEPSCPV